MKNNKTRKLIPKLTKEQEKTICERSNYFYESINVHGEKKEENLGKQLVKELKKAIAPTNITPQNDFYSYINYKWLQETHITESQKYLVQIDDFRLVQDKVYKELIDIVKEYISTNKTEKAELIKNMYESMKKKITISQLKEYGNKMVDIIDNYRNEIDDENNNIWKFLGYINKNEIISWGSPFRWSLNPDDKQSNIFRSYIFPVQVTLLDINLYFDDGKNIEYKKKYKQHYFKYLRDLFKLVFGENHGYRVEDIFDVEVKMLYAMGCDIGEKEDENGYNKIYAKEALKKYNFDWEKFTAALGFKKTPDFFIASSISYLKCGTKLLLDEWKTEQWKTYWVYIYIRQFVIFSKEGGDLTFNFRANFERGMEESVLNLEIFPVFGLGFAFNTFLTNEYYAKYKNNQILNFVDKLAHDLKSVFTKIIENNTWLQPKTKKYAIEKFKHFKFILGKPDNLREDPLLDYKPDEGWENLLKCSYWRHRQAVHLEGKEVIDMPVIDWSVIPFKFIGTQAYVVNACYTPTKNSIYIPLGYLQKPFVDLDQRGIEYNLAYIGFTLSHEMSHSLDDWGSKYDYNGNLHDWWTPEDKKHFKKIQADVIKQYEVFAAYDGIKYDASLGIGEDLADISGMSICLEYLRLFQLNNNDILPICSLSFNTFFVYFAVQYRQQISKKAIGAQLITNPHPLDKYRTNVPLSRSLTFRANYNIQKGDKMYWHSTDRIWSS
jgi:predicted metalloendopeptidase